MLVNRLLLISLRSPSCFRIDTTSTRTSIGQEINEKHFFTRSSWRDTFTNSKTVKHKIATKEQNPKIVIDSMKLEFLRENTCSLMSFYFSKFFVLPVYTELVASYTDFPFSSKPSSSELATTVAANSPLFYDSLIEYPAFACN